MARAAAAVVVARAAATFGVAGVNLNIAFPASECLGELSAGATTLGGREGPCVSPVRVLAADLPRSPDVVVVPPFCWASYSSFAAVRTSSAVATTAPVRTSTYFPSAVSLHPLAMASAASHA